MPRFENPTVLLTRPQYSSERFVRALGAVAGPFGAVICPAFEYESTAPFVPDFDIAIFTSRAGVQFAPDGEGRTAYCVGRTTADAAQQFGYTAISADGAADDLVRLILDQKPNGRLLHLRGETSVGDVMATLVRGGLSATEIIVYRKKIADRVCLSAALSDSGNDIVLPLFSAETVSILASFELDLSAAHAVAISETVADAAMQISPSSVSVAKAPNQAEMIAAVARLIA